MHTLFVEVDTSAMRKKFTKIDEELSTITGFLKARGIQTSFKGPQGGEVNNDVVSTDETSDFYEGYLNPHYLQHILYSIRFPFSRLSYFYIRAS